MTLNSFIFIVYFAVLFMVLGILQLTRRIKKFEKISISLQIGLLLLFSYFFIAKTDWRFCLCTFAITIISYLAGIGINKSEKENSGKTEQAEKHTKLSKIIAYGSCIVLIAILGLFKYYNFFVENFNRLFACDLPMTRLILPIGISFYVFSALSYVIDVYRDKYTAEKNPIFFALYISFFPKITAGPIVRSDEFFIQVKKYRGIEYQAFCEGIQIFVFGLFKKIVLADHLSVFADDVFTAPLAYNTGTVILGVLSYTLQIYFDFSGYSDMAIGISKIIGFDFRPNFNLPYMAENMSDFWKRWHISLSSWLRDYVYIPLGGSKKGEGRAYINLFLTMVVSGIWHGVGWTFIIWGIIHGVVGCISHFIKKFVSPNRRIPKFLGRGLTFIIVSLLWIVFRSTSVENARDVFVSLFTIHSGISQPYVWTFFALACLIFATVLALKKNNGNGFYQFLNLSKFWQQVVFFVFCGVTVIMGYFGNTAFIYGRF